MQSKQSTAQTPAAQASTAAACGEPVYKKIELGLLLEPEVATRQTFDETALAELIESIREIGLILPLVVSPEAESYRVHAGHRRLIACRAIGMSLVECKVYYSTADALDAIQQAENACREAVNAAEEARYFNALLDARCGGDVDRLCARLKLKRDYVETRLILLRGDPGVLDALGGGVISLGVAAELNKVIDNSRRAMYLDAAARGGASIRMVRDWRVNGNSMDAMQGAPAVIETVIAGVAARHEPVEMSMRCYLCGTSEDAHDMELLYVHRSCARVTRRLAEQSAV